MPLPVTRPRSIRRRQHCHRLNRILLDGEGCIPIEEQAGVEGPVQAAHIGELPRTVLSREVEAKQLLEVLGVGLNDDRAV